MLLRIVCSGAGMGGMGLLVSLALVASAPCGAGLALADEPQPPPPPAPTQQGDLGPDQAVEPPFDVDYDSERPCDFYERDWRYRMRHYRGQRFSRDRYSRWDRHPRGHYYGGPYDRRGSHDPRYSSPYGPYDWDYGEDAFDEGYWHGRRDGRRDAEWEQRAEQGLASYLSAMRVGYDAFRGTDYATAVKQFVLAAKLNQGDPASRLQAAHAMTALGHYKEAALALRRAIQLQPQLVYLSLDIRREYGKLNDFTMHYEKLETAAENAGDDPELWFLLGYYQFFAGRSAEAHASVQKADKLDPGNRTTVRLLDAAKLVAPRNAKPRKPAKPAPAAPKPPPRPAERPPQAV